MSTLQFSNAVLRRSINLALAALLCVPLAVLNADNPKLTTKPKPAAKPAASAKPAGAAKPTTTGARPATTTGAKPATTTGTKTSAPTTNAPHGEPSTSSQHGGGGSNPGRVGGSYPGHGGGTVTQTKSGAEIHRDAGGHVNIVHAHGMDIHHGPGGSRTIVRTSPDGARVVANRSGHGYIGHPYSYRGVNYERRTYFHNGRVYGGFYRPYTYWGVPLDVYAPGFYFAPAFYGWAYNPWLTPIMYPWGWAGSPWYGYYGVYFPPYPAYASPALWLTDYYLAQTLQAAYGERAAELANAQLQAPAPITLDVKDAIAREVRREIALENSEAMAGAQATPDPGSSGIARILADNTTHVFVVSTPLDVPSNAGGTCGVTEGDVVQLSPGTPADSAAANMVVLASKGQDCPTGASVQVGIADLQDMQNHMRETIDQGLSDLRAKQGQSGIPAAPAAAVTPPVQTGFAAIAPPDDPNAKAELSETAKEGDQADRQALTESGGQNAGTDAAAPPSVNTGQTIDEVIAILGQPKKKVDLGAKKIYVFDNLKVTFTDGKVTAAE
jgi:hypothetical protein